MNNYGCDLDLSWVDLVYFQATYVELIYCATINVI